MSTQLQATPDPITEQNLLARQRRRAERRRPGGVRELALLAFPVILTQMSVTLMGVVDSAMVGRLGATELAAVGFVGIWSFTFANFFFGLGTVVHHHGQRRVTLQQLEEARQMNRLHQRVEGQAAPLHGLESGGDRPDSQPQPRACGPQSDH